MTRRSIQLTFTDLPNTMNVHRASPSIKCQVFLRTLTLCLSMLSMVATLYTSHKLEPISRLCVLLGYSFTLSAYLCTNHLPLNYLSPVMLSLLSIFPPILPLCYTQVLLNLPFLLSSLSRPSLLMVISYHLSRL